MQSFERASETGGDGAHDGCRGRSGQVDRSAELPAQGNAGRVRTRGLVADASGSAAIEFAIIGMCVVGLVLEVLQVGIYGYQTAALERATYQASRLIKVGTIASQNLNGAGFKNALCGLLPSGMTCARLVASVRNTAEGTAPDGFYAFVKTDRSGTIPPTMDPGTTTFCPGGPSSFVYLQVYYAMPAFSPAWRLVGSTLFQGSPVHYLAAQVVFRNEPYASSGSSC